MRVFLKINIVLVSACVIVLGGWFSFEFIFNKMNEIADKNATEIISSLDKYYQKHNSYPEDVVALAINSNISNKKLFCIFSIPEIRYELEPSKINYRLYYYEAPLGPFHGYNSKVKEWYYEE